MDIKKILSKCDHTLLKQDATWEQIRTTLDEAKEYGCASACIPPSYVAQAKEYVGSSLAICTVIGFPNGYSTTSVKCYEALDAVNNGADEIDVVANIGWIKDGLWDKILDELVSIREVTEDNVMKVIIETCLLTDEEKVQMCRIVSEAEADFIKTSTGFSTGGATPEDIELLDKSRSPELLIKAAGGISGLEDAERLLSLGADRLGTSRIVKLVKSMES